MATTLLTRQQKLFKMDSLYPVDANNIDVEEAISRLFIYLRTGGRQITRTDKPVFTSNDPDVETPKLVMNIALDVNKERFLGVDDDARKALLTSWFESHFALMSRRGKAKGGEYRMSGLRPLHFGVIKLFNPQVKRQDRYLSDFYFNALKDDPELTTNTDSLLKQFFGVGVKGHGASDYKIDEQALSKMADQKQLDIELLFLLRVLEPYETDLYGTKPQDNVPAFSFLCPEQIELLRQDLKLLFLYKSHIPRRELINYMSTLLVFHAAQYFYQIVGISNYIVKHGSFPLPRGIIPKPGEPRSHTPIEVGFFCDMTQGHSSKADDLSKRCFIEHFKDIEQYFRSAFFMRKLEEFASSYLTMEQKKLRGHEYIDLLLKGFKTHPSQDGFFAHQIFSIRENGKDEVTGEPNHDVERIIDVCNQRGLSKLETFVEILYHFQYTTLREQHRKLLAGLCGSDLDRGFMAGRGRTRRKYVIGNELLEMLIQLAVLDKRVSDGKWQSRPITIQEFVDWLRGRYGILIDCLGPGSADDEQTNRALAANLYALKTRLRQMGFFTDLSDASNSQVITPRFQIAE
jgi:hypothetical protein